MSTDRPTHSIIFDIENLDCPDCAASLEKAVRGLPHVVSAELAFAAAKLTVVSSDGDGVVESVRRLGAAMGHRLVPRGQALPQHGRGWRHLIYEHRRDLATVGGGVLILAALVAHALGAADGVVHSLYTFAALVSGMYVARAGWAALRMNHSPDMNTLMSVAAIGAVVVGEFEEAALVMLLFSVGEMLEGYSTGRARNAIRALMQLAPQEATLLGATGGTRVLVAALQVGDRITIRPGERIPMDGQVLEGQSEVDQSPVTGESVPITRGVGQEVYAGSINGSGALTVQVSRLAHDNTIARVMRLVEEAQAQRAPAQRFVDRFARVYTPTVMALAAAVAVVPPLLGMGSLSQWLYRALVLLVISCPCALVISTPVTIVSALATAARAGVLIKGGRHLEELAEVRAVAFDKTGTLTLGQPRVVESACEHAEPQQGEVRRLGGDVSACSTCRDLVARAAAVEARSEHALARLVVEYARSLGVEGRYALAQGVTSVAGMGVQGVVAGSVVRVGNHAYCHSDGHSSDAMCQRIGAAEQAGRTVIVVEDESRDAQCYLAVADTLRPKAADIVRQLERAGVRHTIMLTGDNDVVAESIARQAHIPVFRAGLMPEAKVEAVRELQVAYGSVAMVGDGVNDAPALAQATVGIAMGAAGTAAALESADIALMGDDLAKLPFAITLGRRALSIVRANIAFSLGIKAVFLALAVMGYTTMWMAVLADMGASLLVTFNGLRMLGFRSGVSVKTVQP